MGNFLKPLATINLPKSSIFLGIFGEGIKIYHFYSEIIFGQLFLDIWRFFSGHTAWGPPIVKNILTFSECFLDVSGHYVLVHISFKLRLIYLKYLNQPPAYFLIFNTGNIAKSIIVVAYQCKGIMPPMVFLIYQCQNSFRNFPRHDNLGEPGSSGLDQVQLIPKRTI